MVIVPLVYSGYLSLYRKRLIGGRSFAGAENYIRALTDPLFVSGVGRMAIFLVIQVPFMIALRSVLRTRLGQRNDEAGEVQPVSDLRAVRGPVGRCHLDVGLSVRP